MFGSVPSTPHREPAVVQHAPVTPPHQEPLIAHQQQVGSDRVVCEDSDVDATLQSVISQMYHVP